MSNETKRDVFERALTEWYDLIFKVGGQGNEAYGYCEFDVTLSKYEKDYDAALPDDMPVIPEAVGEYIEEAKAHGKWSIIDPLWRVGDALSAMGESGLSDRARWIFHNSDEFSRAWLLGVWRIKETGAIVKLDVK